MSDEQAQELYLARAELHEQAKNWKCSAKIKETRVSTLSSDDD